MRIATLATAAFIAAHGAALAAENADLRLTYIVPASQESVQRQPVPNAVFQDPSGARIQLAKLKGQVVVLNFWSRGCSPCIKQMPLLDRLQGAFANQKLLVLAVLIDPAGAAPAKSFFAQNGYSFLRPYADPTGYSAQRLGVGDLPTTIIIDRFGREVGRAFGDQRWDSAQITQRLNYLLYEPQ